MTNIETLIDEKGYSYDDRWHPLSVNYMEELVSGSALNGMPIHQRKNIAYSLMYLQYLELQIQELRLHSVIESMVYKNYVITGMSIIESIFYYLLKSIGKWRTLKWKEEEVVETNVFKGKDGISRKYVITTVRKLDEPELDEMNFDSVINKIQDSKIFESKDIPLIKKYKKLRNRVHLQIGDNKSDTDYFNFNKKDYYWTKKLLFTILSNPIFENKKTDLDFLMLSEDGKQLLL